MNYLKEKLQSLGLSQQTATRRANKVLKEDQEIIRMFTWGLDTYGEYAPTDITKINDYYREEKYEISYRYFECYLHHVKRTKELAYMIIITTMSAEKFFKENGYTLKPDEMKTRLLDILKLHNVPEYKAKQLTNNLVNKNKACVNEVIFGLSFFDTSSPVTFKQIFIDKRNGYGFKQCNEYLTAYEDYVSPRGTTAKSPIWEETVACIAINAFLQKGGLRDILMRDYSKESKILSIA